MQTNNRSLFELDNSLKPVSAATTPLIKRHNSLLLKKLEDFENEDLRFMIGQKTGLEYLVPIAINILQSDIFAEGDFYEGDLLQKVLSIDRNFWVRNHELYIRLIKILQKDFDINKIDTTDEIKEVLQSLAGKFLNNMGE